MSRMRLITSFSRVRSSIPLTFSFGLPSSSPRLGPVGIVRANAKNSGRYQKLPSAIVRHGEPLGIGAGWPFESKNCQGLRSEKPGLKTTKRSDTKCCFRNNLLSILLGPDQEVDCSQKSCHCQLASPYWTCFASR